MVQNLTMQFSSVPFGEHLCSTYCANLLRKTVYKAPEGYRGEWQTLPQFIFEAFAIRDFNFLIHF